MEPTIHLFNAEPQAKDAADMNMLPTASFYAEKVVLSKTTQCFSSNLWIFDIKRRDIKSFLISRVQWNSHSRFDIAFFCAGGLP